MFKINVCDMNRTGTCECQSSALHLKTTEKTGGHIKVSSVCVSIKAVIFRNT